MLVITTLGLLGIGLVHLKDQRTANIEQFRSSASARAAKPDWVREATPIINLRLPNGQQLQFSGPDVRPVNSWYEPHPSQWYRGKAVVHARVAEDVHAELHYSISVGQLVPTYAEAHYISAAEVAQRLAQMNARPLEQPGPSPVARAKAAVKKLLVGPRSAASAPAAPASAPSAPAQPPAAPASSDAPVEAAAPEKP